MVQLTIAYPTSLTSSNHQENLSYDFNRSLFHPSEDFPIITHTPFYGLFPYGLWFHIHPSSIPPCPTSALASNIYNHSISNPSPRFRFLSVTYHYPLRHNSPHTDATFLFHIWYSNAIPTFETNSYPQQYHLQVHSVRSLR